MYTRPGSPTSNLRAEPRMRTHYSPRRALAGVIIAFLLLSAFATAASESHEASSSSCDTMALNVLVVGATGGLGRAVVREALERGHRVSVLVRDTGKLQTVIGPDAMRRLAQIHVGDAINAQLMSDACAGKDVVLSGYGGDAAVAKVVAERSKAANVKKLVYVAGAGNVLTDDGVTYNYVNFVKAWPALESVFHRHEAVIAAIEATGVNHVIFCPGFMKEAGSKSAAPPVVRVNRPVGSAISYEDAATVMLDAAEKPDWDGERVAASSV